MDRDGLRASVIYGPLSLGFPIDDPALQNACYAAWNDWAIEEFNAVAPDRLCVLAFLPEPLAGGRGRGAGALRGARSPRRDRRRLRHRRSATRPGTACGPRREHTGLPISFHIKGGTSSKLSYQIGKWQSAAFASLLPLQLDEPLATMVFCGRARAASRPQARAGGVGRRVAAVLLDPHGHGVARAPRQARLRDRDRAERAVPPPGDGHVRGGPLARSSSRCSAPTRACGRPTIRTPTARSRTRATRSRRRSARCPPPTAARSPRRTAPGCTASRMTVGRTGPDRRLRPRLAADAGHRRDGRVLPRARLHVAEHRTWSRCTSGPDDQLPPPGDVAARGLHAPRAERAPPCGDLCFVWDGTPDALHARSTTPAPRHRGPGRGRAAAADASSVYVRDPDGNLLEFMIYP